MSKLYSGAEIVFKCLEDQDVEFIFGYPGGAVLPIYDELKNHSSIKHILVRPDGPLWEKAIKTEWDALMEKQVMSLGWTKEALLKAGIRKPAVDCRFLYDVKYKPDSSFDKYKARFIQLGHPGNCFKGVHYNEVFTATPQMTSTRILQALRIGKGWHSMPADVKTAFLHADTEEAQQYPLRMPIEKREYLTDENGNKHELFAMLHKNLYGSPVAPKLWSDCFNKWIREKFNSELILTFRTPIYPIASLVD